MSLQKRKSFGAKDDLGIGKGKKRRPADKASDSEDDVRHSKAGGSGKFADNAGRNQSDKNKPAELFRKDLISAMKMPDSEPLLSEEYIQITDPWRQDWEKGVQVPVNPEFGKQFNVVVTPLAPPDKTGPFRLPERYIQTHADPSRFDPSKFDLSDVNNRADTVCRYDLDDIDVSWLEKYNEERVDMGQDPIPEWKFEKIIEELETKCYENMQHIKQTSIGLGIEYDENSVCNVCQSPDSEDSNEMVFCDGCDVCVHQACYGVQNIPTGKWYCRTCSLNIKPQCVLCPKTGGAMKPTRSGQKWAHVSCALWIPEVSIGDAEKMEPVTKIKDIKPTRWSLICCVCRIRQGACIQCSVKTCKTAFHVTCAFEHKLDMRTEVIDREVERNNEEEGADVNLKAFCPKHTEQRKTDPKVSPRKDSQHDQTGMTEQEKATARANKIAEIEEKFSNCVSVDEIASLTEFDRDLVSFVYEYWKLKRRSNFNGPLLAPKDEEEDMLTKQQEGSLIARQKMFVQLRQDLERVRNLCYMITRREKQRKLFYTLRERVFRKQLQVIQMMSLAKDDLAIVIDANHSDTIYDNPQLWKCDAELGDESQSHLSEVESSFELAIDKSPAERSRTEKVSLPRRTPEETNLNNPWKISKALQDRVHSKIFRTKKPKPYINGVSDRTQKRLDIFFKPLPRQLNSSLVTPSSGPLELYGSCGHRVYQDVDNEVSIYVGDGRSEEKENLSDSDDEIDIVKDSLLYPKVSDLFPQRVTRSRLTDSLARIWQSVTGL